jgi:small-conductance mechanosensitive channel
MLPISAGRTPGLWAKPEPFVLHKALSDFCVTHEINVYCNQPQGMNRIYKDLHRNILDVFNEYGVQIMNK